MQKVKVDRLSPEEESELLADANTYDVIDHYQKLVDFYKAKFYSHKSLQNYLIKRQGTYIADLKTENNRLKDKAEQPRGPSFLEDEANAWCKKYHDLRRESAEHIKIVRTLRDQVSYLETQLEGYRKEFSRKYGYSLDVDPTTSKTKRMPIGNRSYNRRNKRKSKITSGKRRRR